MWQIRPTLFATRRSNATLGVCIGLLLLCVLPLNRSVNFPAVLLPAQEAWLYPPEPSRIVSVYVKAGDRVTAGQVVAELSAPDIQQKWKLATQRFALTEVKLARIAVDKKDIADYVVLRQQRKAVINEIKGLRQRIASLEVRTNLDGFVSEVTPGLDEGVWVARDSLLIHVAASNGAVVAGLVSERESARLELGAAATFIPEDGIGAGVDAILTEAGNLGGEGVEFGYQSSTHGGAIALAATAGGARPIPVTGLVPLRFSVNGMAPPPKAQRGTLTAQATPTSFLAQAFGRVATVFMREIGF